MSRYLSESVGMAYHQRRIDFLEYFHQRGPASGFQILVYGYIRWKKPRFAGDLHPVVDLDFCCEVQYAVEEVCSLRPPYMPPNYPTSIATFITHPN